MRRGSRTGRHGRTGQATTGVLLMAAGTVLLLDQIQVIEIGSYFRYWPVVLIAVGLVRIAAPRDGRDIPGGAGTVLWGGWFLACNLHWLGLTYANSWPLIFVIMGVAMILKALVSRGEDRAAPEVKEARDA